MADHVVLQMFIISIWSLAEFVTRFNFWSKKTTSILNFSRQLATLTIWSLFNHLAVPAPHLLSPFLAHQPSPHWKSQIAHSDMHHPVSGINFLILSVSLPSHVSTHLLLLIHLSAHLPFQQILPILDFFYLPDCLHDNGTGPDLSCSSFYFSFIF